MGSPSLSCQGGGLTPPPHLTALSRAEFKAGFVLQAASWRRQRCEAERQVSSCPLGGSIHRKCAWAIVRKERQSSYDRLAEDCTLPPTSEAYLVRGKPTYCYGGCRLQAQIAWEVRGQAAEVVRTGTAVGGDFARSGFEASRLCRRSTTHPCTHEYYSWQQYLSSDRQ